MNPYPPIPPSSSIGVEGLLSNQVQPIMQQYDNNGAQPNLYPNQQVQYPPGQYSGGPYPPPPYPGMQQQPPGYVYPPLDQQQQLQGQPSLIDMNNNVRAFDDEDPLEVQPAYTGYDSFISYRSRRLLAFGVAFLSMSLWILGLVMVQELSCTFGRMSSGWETCFVPIVIFGPVFCVFMFFLMNSIGSNVGYSSRRASRNLTVAAIVWYLCVTIACGIPYGMYCGFDESAAQYIDPKYQKSIHCWKDPNLPITYDNTHYVTLEETGWKVEWALTYKQKVFSQYQSETDDDGYTSVWTNNFCIAPVNYLGNAPYVTYNFYAACYIQTVTTTVTTCTQAEATLCGWDFPPATVVLRTLGWGYNYETLFGFPKAEIDGYRRTTDLLDKDPNKQSALVVEYASDGPDGM
eukprot:PhF_6_TR925/c2_g1_i1/m.1577